MLCNRNPRVYANTNSDLIDWLEQYKVNDLKRCKICIKFALQSKFSRQLQSNGYWFSWFAIYYCFVGKGAIFYCVLILPTFMKSVICIEHSNVRRLPLFQWFVLWMPLSLSAFVWRDRVLKLINSFTNSLLSQLLVSYIETP